MVLRILTATSLIIPALLLAALMQACSTPAGLATAISNRPGGESPPVAGEFSTWPAALPADALQPWEHVDEQGRLIPGHGTAGVTPDSNFVAGVERTGESPAGVSDNGEAVHLDSGPAGAGGLSAVWFRVELGGIEPGLVSADANLLPMDNGHPSEYWLGLSNYSHGAWEWHGPFVDNHVRLSTGTQVMESTSYLSSLGNLFVCVVAHDGARLDVVGVGADSVDPADSTAPPAPAGLTATPVDGGLDLQWNGVIAGDLGGYRLYYSSQDFSGPGEGGVTGPGYLVGATSHLLADVPSYYVAVSAVDLSGNESPLSTVVQAVPLAGAPPPLSLLAGDCSGLLHDVIQLTATGATEYAWDLDGDGTYEETGDTTGLRMVDTSRTGIIRPAVRGSTSASCVGCSAVSLIITGNSRPVASAVATPQYGPAPLLVTLTGTADDAEDAPGELVFAWDYDGDGLYETGTDTLNPPAQYYVAGLHNIKLRVEDSAGAWDVDTVAVQAVSDANLPPIANLTANRTTGDAPLTLTLDASLSQDLDGTITGYEWDWDSDGVYDYDSGGDPDQIHVWYGAGYFAVTVRVTDNEGATAVDTLYLAARGLYTVRPDSADDVGGSSTLITVNGHPAIAYHDYTNGSLKYVRALDRDGTEWGTPVTVIDEFHDAGFNNSMCLANGRPAICYVIASGVNDLYYVQAVDNDGTAWQTPVLIEDAHPVNFVSMTGILNQPAIAYHSWAEEDIRYIRANDFNGTSWGTSYVAAHVGGGLETKYPCVALAQVNGLPALAYYDLDTDEMCYVRAADSSGTGWGTPVVVDSTDDVGRFPSIAVVNTKPMICYHDATNLLLKCARAEDFNGTSWGDPQILDDTQYAGRHSSIAIVNNRPAVSYCTMEFAGDWVYNLRCIRALDASGETWGLPVQLDGELDAGQTNCVAQINGSLAVSYYDGANGNLVYALMIE